MEEGETIQRPKENEHRTNNNLQNTKYKINGWVTQTPQKVMGELMCSGG
jgi:hypothetical protein